MKPLTHIALVAAITAASACSGASPLAPAATSIDVSSAAAPIRNTAIVHIPLFVEDAGRQPPSDDNTRLFEVRTHKPVMAPDGHQITFAEFRAPQGSASVLCSARGTVVTLQLTHLIPDALYTAWNVVFKAPGFEPTFANLIGLGALGWPSETQNVFRSSPIGEAAISTVTAPGPLSAMGSIGACAPRDEFEWHVVGAYHLDGRSHGATLGPDGTAVEQFGFIFNR